MAKSYDEIFVQSAIEPGVFIHKVGTIMGKKVHGYNTPGGGWALMPSVGDSPAEFLGFREKGRRKIYWFNCKIIKPPEGTWNPE